VAFAGPFKKHVFVKRHYKSRLVCYKTLSPLLYLVLTDGHANDEYAKRFILFLNGWYTRVLRTAAEGGKEQAERDERQVLWQIYIYDAFLAKTCFSSGRQSNHVL
jgi:hypothetical protein